MKLPVSRWASPSALLAIVLVLLAAGSPALGAETPRRIFLLQGLTATQPGAQRAIEAFKSRLQERSSEYIEVYTDFLDIGRYPGPEHEERLVRFLSARFAQVKPDLIIPMSRGATSFAIRRRDEIAPGTPIIYCCTPASVTEDLNMPSDVPGILLEYDWAGTLALAERLQPNARTLAIVSGSSDADRRWLLAALEELQPHLGRYDTRFLTGLGFDVLLKEVSQLPRDSIVILMPIFDDGWGQSRLATEVALEVAEASSAPAYSPVVTLHGGGIVGGNMDSFTRQGSEVADRALEILAGKSPSALPHQMSLPLQYRVDARQLERWGLSASALPAGTSVEFQRPQLWEEYKTAIIGTLSAIAVLIGIITLLLIQMRKRKAAERALKESEDRMAFAAASTNVGLWRMDLSTGQLWATDHCRAMFGISPDAPLTWDAFRSVIHPDDRLAFAEWEQFAGRSGPFYAEFRIVLPGHDVRWFLCRGRIVSDNAQGPLQISGIFADVTARKRAEAEAELQRDEIAHLMRVAAIGELSGGIAHELSQPLAAILANAQAAQSLFSGKSDNRETIAQILDDVVEEGQRAGQVIHRMRRLLKKGEPQSVLLNLNELVKSTLALLRSELLENKVKVEVELDPRLPLVSGDPVQLQQVLLNLLMNAMEAMDPTETRARGISVVTRVGIAGHVEVLVSDRGTGIAPEALRRLFQPFFTTKARGLGLGLKICSTIIGSHGGRLSLANANGGGATATVSLPAALQFAAAS